MSENVWQCRIGGDVQLAPGADFPMRRAIEAAFVAETGCQPSAIFSGWGESWTGTERACIENRYPTADEFANSPQGKDAEIASLRSEALSLRVAAAANLEKLRRVRELLSENGCDCSCDHDPGDHDADCDECLACRVAMALLNATEATQ